MKTNALKKWEAPRRHPDAIALEKWEKDNPESFDASSLGATRPDYYLRNRLHLAFIAGTEAARNSTL
jgi:hypothetical protein